MKLKFQKKIRIQLVASILFCLMITLCLPVESFSQPNNWEKRIQLKARKYGDGLYYAGIQKIAEVLGSSTYYSNKIRKAILYIGDEKITVTAFNPFVILGKRVLQMPIAARYERNDIQVPIKFFVPILKMAITEDVNVEGNPVANRSLPINIEGVSVEDKTNGTLIRVRALVKFDDSKLSTRYSRKWLYVDILGGSIDPSSFVTLNQSDLVNKVVPVQMTQMVQLSFQMKREIDAGDVKFVERDKEIWISIPRAEGVSKDVIRKLKDDQEKWRIDKIVIDPGHGGRDPGTIGHSGTHEKDVVLEIAKKLKKMLEKELDVKVLMTRDKDEYLSLEERTQFANKNGGKLFISIHANWNRNPNVNGSATYFLGLAKSDEALEISQRENAVIKYDDANSDIKDLTEEQIILATMAQNSYNKESQNFAAMIQESIDERTRLRNRGVKQAGFYVLVGASMPNVLVETAFMSNKREERLLNSSSFQQKMAQAIFQSVKDFKKRYEWSSTNGNW